MGYDFSVVNSQPGTCEKCKGSGVYRWGASVNGRMKSFGPCWSCKGTGKQSQAQRKNNRSYNHFKMQAIAREMFK